MLKTLGYLISTLSVLLLGAAAWPGAAEHSWGPPVLIVGMAASILGMLCRWLAYLKDHRKELMESGMTWPPFP